MSLDQLKPTQVTEVSPDSKPLKTNRNVSFFDKFPWKLREEVFKILNDYRDPNLPRQLQQSYFVRKLRIPALVVALRDQPSSYDHVLEWFSKANGGKLNIGNHTGCCFTEDMNERELQTFSAVNISLSSTLFKYLNCQQYLGGNTSKSKKPEFFTQQFLHATNIRSVKLCLGWNVLRDDEDRFIIDFPLWLAGFKALSKVEIEIPSENDLMLNHKARIQYTRRQISKKLGIQGHIVSTIRYWNLEDYDIEDDQLDQYLWLAPKG